MARCDDILPLTVGQRARISGQPQGYWVAGRDVGRGVVWVCQGSQHRALSSDGCVVRDVSWVSNDEASALLLCLFVCVCSAAVRVPYPTVTMPQRHLRFGNAKSRKDS